MGQLTNLLGNLITKTLQQLISITDAEYPGDPNGTAADNAYFNANVHPYIQALGWVTHSKNTLYVKSDAPDDFNGSDSVIFQTAQAALNAIPTTGSLKPTASNPWKIVGDPTIDFSTLDWTAHSGAGTSAYISVLNNSSEPMQYGIDTGTANAKAIAVKNLSLLFVGLKVRFKNAVTNTGATTATMNSITAATIKKNISSDLIAGDLTVGGIYEIVWDGTNWQLMGTQSLASQIVYFGISSLITPGTYYLVPDYPGFVSVSADTPTNGQMKYPIPAGTWQVSDLQIGGNSGSGTLSLTITIRKNGSDTAITKTISITSGTWGYGADNADTITVTQGDFLMIKMVLASNNLNALSGSFKIKQIA